MRQWIWILPIIFLLNGCDPAVKAYHQGNNAYQYGNYQTAFTHYLYAARGGVTPAQYAVGYQYYYGQGTKEDQAKGIIWLKRAAHHSYRARYALNLIEENKPIPPWQFQLCKDLNNTSAASTTYYS